MIAVSPRFHESLDPLHESDGAALQPRRGPGTLTRSALRDHICWLSGTWGRGRIFATGTMPKAG
jgi:hypothetical protein